MKPINKLTVDLLTEKYVNNGTLESKFKELFDRITVIHGDIFAESMIMELENGTNWNDGNNFNIKRVDQKTNSDYVDILNLPKLLLVDVKPEKFNFFGDKETEKKFYLIKLIKEFANIIGNEVYTKEIKSHIDLLWATLKDMQSCTEVEKYERCLDLMYPIKANLLEKSTSGKIESKKFHNIYIEFEKALPSMVHTLTDLGFICVFKNKQYGKQTIKETDKV